MNLNPEFRRYCWLELTPHRLIAVPVIIGLIMILVGASSTGQTAEALTVAGISGFGVCAALYGSYLALSAMPEEARERTWDFQRMSALTPGELAVGKVFGAPVVAWYAGGLSLLIFLGAGARQLGLDVLLIAASVVLSTIALHASAMTLGIHAVRAGATRNPGAMFVFLLIMASSVPTVWITQTRETGITWWGRQVPQLWFVFVSALLFAGWTWLGAARSFAAELRVRQLPWAWPSFCLFLGVWVGGLIEVRTGGGINRAVLVILLFFLFTGLGAYLLLLTERTGAMTLARVLRTLRGELEGGVRRALQSLPLWSVSLVAAWVAALLLMLLPWTSRPGDVASSVVSALSGEGRVMPLALAAMLLRDAGIYCIFALTRFPRRPALAAVMYVILLDGVFPALMVLASLDTLAFLVFPLGRASALGAFAIFIIHALVAWSLAWWRWSDGQKLDLTT